ncbi:putative acyl-CoA ligase [Nocardia nova SH22a]|uniref:Putative acyl-CoA ligase n=1 Tax=Nocardia nova SH22a TaxID=1415166 RepID=W5TMC3_9NOCA|nr:putative acyl-CoA ligase [Nocardia nova SH22a]
MCKKVTTEVFDTAVELPVARSDVWKLLTDPQLYPRIFIGIGACDRVETIAGAPVWQLRIGTAATEIRTLSVTVRAGHPGSAFELSCAATGSFASIRLREIDGGTRVVVTCFAAGRVHPVASTASTADALAWLDAGLRRLRELTTAAPTSVLVNGEDAPLRRRAEVARRIVGTGVVHTARPDRSVGQLRGLARWGFNLAGGYAAAAGHSPDRIAIVDDEGSRTFAEIDRRSSALASGMSGLGLRSGDAIGLLARNHAGMVETMVAAGKLGVDTILLNAGLSARRIEEIVQRHRLAHVFVDAELDSLIHYLHADIERIATDAGTPGRTTIEDLIDSGAGRFAKPARPGRLVVLTSGTSGTPKGARRPHAKGFATVAALLSRIPLRMNDTMLIPAPLFHTWGLAALQLSTALRATVVLPAQFDAADTLRRVAEHRAGTVILVPTMVQRILDLPTAVRARHDTSCLRVAASCGAPLAGATVLRFADCYGDVLYNVYGSTEVSWATIATPEDLRTAPATAGRPPLGTRLAVLGPDRAPVPIGATGRIYVGNHMLFDGYVNSAPPEETDGMLDTGDLGYLDADGRLFIAGRDDEMIISGGENVFPRPVEEALSHLPQITDVAVVGVPDREFGQRLAAFIVKREGSGLDPDMIRTYVRNRLSRFSVPRDVTFLSALPRGETGKVLKRLLIGGPPELAGPSQAATGL